MQGLQPLIFAKFEKLFARYQKPVESKLRSWIGNDDSAQELAQEVFVRILKNMDKLDENRDPAGWIFTIARNVFIDYAKKKERQIQIEEFVEAPADLELETEMEKEFLLEDLRRFIHELPDPERSVLILHKIKGLTVQETARRIKISPRSVNRRLAVALVTLKHRMQTGSGAGVKAPGRE